MELSKTIKFYVVILAFVPVICWTAWGAEAYGTQPIGFLKVGDKVA